MCTAVSYCPNAHYFGRNLDLEYSYRESVTVTPRRFRFGFRHVAEAEHAYAMIGMAYLADGYPLYYDATNEKGLSAAGLNFPGFAHYLPEAEGYDLLAPYEFIPFVLSRCATVREARQTLARVRLTPTDFSPALPRTPLHWMIADRTESIVVEPLADGLHLCDDPVGVLTNSPTFDYHLLHLCDYMGLSREEAVSRIAPTLTLAPYSRGMGAMGLPGDLSSSSRFVKAAFTKLNSVCGAREEEGVSQFFHILGAVEQQRGCVRVGKAFEVTVYSSCCNTDRGVYYYTTYGNRQITAVDLYREDLDGGTPVSYPLIQEQQIRWQNGARQR